ncbi:MAG TPA: alpha/beta fold hydrolase [Gemmatales bacterium]|nr:alpha/beta fold hydrolase [Gemmatales bacterium]HMP60307.1 alpha/beta fold hydrolase [Gemmatales bacterium]
MRLAICIGFALVLGLGPLRADPKPEPCPAPPAALIIILPGIEGVGACTRDMLAGLRRGCPEAEFEVYDWTTGKSLHFLQHLADLDRNRQVAAHLAAHIQQRQSACPERPIILVGHSGGAALIALALVRLPEGCRVRQAVMLAPGLHCEYPLAPVLSRTETGIDVFYSRIDTLILGLGTVILGTVDRRHGPSAGLVGFTLPPETDADSRAWYESHLRQYPFTPRRAISGWKGGHFSSTERQFIERQVAPLLAR